MGLTGGALARPPLPAGLPAWAPGAERGLIVLVALHSAAVGALLALFPRFALDFAGFDAATPAFFPRQAGVFHLVLAFGYLREHFRGRGISLLLFAKGTAAVFLLLTAAASDVPWAIPVSGIADGLMGVAAWAIHHLAGPGGNGDRLSL